jgi:hypothetical protein
MGNVTRVPVDFLSVNSRMATPAFFHLARSHGKTLHLWTVNDRETALRIINLGADHLITDEPALLAELRRELRELDEVERLVGQWGRIYIVDNWRVDPVRQPLFAGIAPPPELSSS